MSRLLLAALAAAAVLQQAAPGSIFGFAAKTTAAQRLLERRFLAAVDTDRIREFHETFTAEPHVAGSPRDRELADWTRARWREYGLEQVEIVEHQVLLPYVSEILVEMPGAAPPWRATLTEDPIARDPATAVDAGPAYHAYSASADVTAPVVYAGSGNPAEYDWLDEHGISVEGKIVLVRYSVPYVYRGFKVQTAQQRGAAGILIYSDPEDDGSAQGPAYPDGPWGPDAHIQRGAVGFTFETPGDPLTPGWASVPGAKRIPMRDATTLPSIPSAPLSARDARAIMQALDGPEVPREWQGGLPLPYRAGGGAPEVHLRVKMDDAVRPIWSVTGRIAGSEHPDDLVIVGNHRDAWIYGGVDPSSGSAALMELARSLGGLARQGFRPKRTIVFASWDAEEFSLTGSTEWGEQHEREIAEHAVAYLNVDSAASGTAFTASAVPSLNRLITEAAGSVVDPETGHSIAAAGRRSDLVNNRIGTGSDYAVFLNFAGVPIADLSFNGPYGVYHSLYDTHAWVQRFGDPGFRYQMTTARLWGVMALRLANADLLPLDYRAYAARMHEFVDDLRTNQPAERRGSLLLLREAVNRFATAAGELGARVDRLLAGDRPAPPVAASINAALMAAERAFISSEGLQGRPWFRHLIFAPEPSYAAQVLPGLTEAIRAGDRPRVDREVERLVAALDRASALLRSAGL